MNKQIITKSDDVIFHTDDRYRKLFKEIKDKIRTSRIRAASAVNKEVITLYWYIGKRIIEKQTETTWGDRFLETLANDLQQTFPEIRGLSTRNLKYMRQFAAFYKELEFGQQAVAQLPAIVHLPWGHIILLIQTVKDARRREWYTQQAIENGRVRSVLKGNKIK